jgi:hypothetical protein
MWLREMTSQVGEVTVCRLVDFPQFRALSGRWRILSRSVGMLVCVNVWWSVGSFLEDVGMFDFLHHHHGQLSTRGRDGNRASGVGWACNRC